VKKILLFFSTLSIAAYFLPIAALILSAIALFLSLWIVIPAPNATLLPFGVVAPELSPWLLGLNAIALLLALKSLKFGWSYLTLTISVAALVISTLPLLQLSGAIQQSDRAISQTLGADYLAKISPALAAKLRPAPFVLADVFRGIATPEVRYTAGIPFAKPAGMPLTLDVYQPLQAGNYPAIVVLYGGAWQEGSPTHNAEFNRYMAAQGYVVWAISYRHAPQFRFPAHLEDVRSALKFIQQHAEDYDTDPTRLALMGRSAGGHLAMLAAYQPDAPPIRAVVNYYSPVDLTTGYYDLPNPDPIDAQAVLRNFLGGTPEELPELYRSASPITYVTRPLPPSLLIYASRDHLVQAKFGRSLSDRLRVTNTPTVYLEIPWAEHAFDAVFNGVSNQLALYYTERFLAHVLTRDASSRLGNNVMCN
jgi:acetyl esterase/lipase